MKKIILFGLLLLNVQLFGSGFKKTGTAGFTFLELPVSARNSALGESSISLEDLNSTAVFSNPGALGFMRSSSAFSATYAPWIADINQYAASYALSTSIGSFGFSTVIMDYGTMQRTVKLEGQRVYEQIGTFGASSMALGFTYSKALTDKFSFGITAKYVSEKIDVYSASNVVMDGGMLYYTGLGSLRIAAAIQNFGTNAKFKNSDFKMPAMLRLGASGEVFQNDKAKVTLILEAVHPTDADERLNLGTEVEWMNILTFRGGYKLFYDEEKLSFGLGVKVPMNYPVNLDFSYADYGRLGNLIRLTLQMSML